MLRVRLALVIGILLCFVLSLGFALYWGSEKVALYLHRSEMAYETFDTYAQMSQEAYRHFKQRMDLLLVDREASAADVELSRRRLDDAIDRLKKSTVKEIGAVIDADDRRGQQGEPERVARLTDTLKAAMHQFDEVERLRQQGKRDKALLLLSKVLEEDIDRKFEPLIDASINGEREQALMARARLTALADQLRWIALLVACAAAIFSISAGALLFKGIRRPMEALMRGTEEIAAGNLDYRIAIESHDEFGYLARHFNQMSGELELQQEKLWEARAVLEQKVAARTLELNQLNGELQRMDQARRQFFADISHELRTPITVIRGEAEVTLRGRDKGAEEYKETLQRIRELSMQLGKLVNDLLFLARAETAHLQFEWQTLELGELVSGVVDDIRVLAREKAVEVSMSTPAEPVWVRGDKHRLRQVLFILGDNACRYSNADGQIGIALQTDEKDAKLTVQDQGIGIPAQDLEIIFDRYYRSTNARRSAEDGTGLGLPVAKSIIKAHGGQIAVTSAEGVGTTFTVTLPQIQQPALAEVA